jgi:antirestriction protein
MSDTRIYVASLAAYNAGRLHGAWIDLSLDKEPGDVLTEIEVMLATSPTPGEEWAIHDHEGFNGINIGEHEPIARVIEHAMALDEHGSAWAVYVGNVGEHYATWDDFEERYRGEYDSPEAYARELIEETHDLKAMGSLVNYINYESFARDMSYDGWEFALDKDSGTYHVFSP